MNKSEEKLIIRILRLLRDVIEKYIPFMCFIILFIAFIAQIFWRYILRNPIGWTSELIVIMFVWMILFGSLLSSRKNTHVRFTMITDALPKKWDAAFEFLGDLIVAVLFILSVKPTYDYIVFMQIQKTSILHISMKIIFMPYLIFLIGAIIYTITEMIDDFCIFFGKEPIIKAAERQEVK